MYICTMYIIYVHMFAMIFNVSYHTVPAELTHVTRAREPRAALIDDENRWYGFVRCISPIL